MVRYQYPAAIALDPNTGDLALNAPGDLYAVTDTPRANPLPVYDRTGAPIAAPSSNRIGYLPPFEVDDHLRVVWRSRVGGHEREILSIDGVLELVGQAVTNAEDARLAAESLAALVEAPADTTIGTLLADEGSVTHQAILALIAAHGGSGGGGTVVYVYRDGGGDWPATRPDVPTVVAVGIEPAPPWLVDGDMHDIPVGAP